MDDYMAYLEDVFSEKISFKLIEKEAEQFYKTHSLEKCYTMGLDLYHSSNYQVQEAGIYLLGYAATEDSKLRKCGKL